MSAKYLIAATFLLAAPAAQAQAGPTATKSPAQITCEMTGDCEEADLSLANREKDDARGFSIRRKANAPSSPQPSVASKPSAGSAGYSSARSTQRASTPGQRVAQVRQAATPGRGHTSLAVGFALASATLDPQGIAQANSLLVALKGPKMAGRRVLVSGHTDAIGNREYNLELSQRRAAAVVDYLATHGIDRSLLEARGHGFDRPLPGREPKSSANRRVEIEFAS